MNRRALITGSAGFVGRHFHQHLHEWGWAVRHCDLLCACPKDALDLFREDSSRYDLVIHAAAVVGGRLIIDGDPLRQAVNLALDAEMFRWAVRTGARHVVYFSSSAAYPVDLQGQWRQTVKLRESLVSLNNPQEPDKLYGWTKITGERLAVLARDHGVKVTVVRPFSGYGTDQSLDYPFPAFIDRARKRIDPFPVWGTGEQTRDFIHIDDIVAATMALVREEVGGAVNLGTGRETSFLTLQQMVCEAAGYSPRVQVNPSAPTGVFHRVADTELLSHFYTPKVSLEEGVRRALDGEL